MSKGEVDLYYTDVGEGPETILFSHGLLYDTAMWSHQIEYFKDRYRCIAYDSRGHGRSPITQTGYDMDTIADDAIALIEKLDIGPCHFVGLSMGGFVGLRLAMRRPDLLKSLTLLDTSAEREPRPRVYLLKVLNFIGRWTGFRFVMGMMMPGMFGKDFMSNPVRKEEREFWANRLSNTDRTGMFKASYAVLDRESVVDEIDGIKLPTLIMYGEEDVVTDRSKSERMNREIAGSTFKVIAGSGHMSAIEKPEIVNAAIEELLGSIGNK